MNQYFKKRLNESDMFLILVNLVPVWGVWFQGWSPREIFLVYCLESVLIGAFNIVRLLMTTLVKGKDEWDNNSGVKKMVSGIFFIVFFIFHYGFFLFVQMSIFLAISDIKGVGPHPAGAFDFVLHFPKYLSQYALWLLITFAISYAFQILKDFVWSGAYRTASLSTVMFEPYIRVFVQQFAVIIGAIFLMFGGGKFFILIFAITKTVFEVFMDYDKMMKTSKEKMPKEKLGDKTLFK